jgi:adenylate cyclase
VNLRTVFAELKRRNVYKVAIAYAVIAWLLMQISTQVFPFLEIPNWAIRLVIMLLALGFPIALIIAWALRVIIAGAISVGVFFLGRYTSSKRNGAESPTKSIAVPPFDNQNRDPNTDYLSVDPRKVGNDLGVAAVLMGRLIQQGDNLAIRTDLVNVADGTELWGQQYKLADVFAVQEEIAREISEKLRLKLSGAERQQLAKRPTENLKAFQYYSQGRSALSSVAPHNWFSHCADPCLGV